MIYRLYIKELLERLISILLVVALSPLFVLVFLMLMITQPSPYFYKQMRSGKDLVPFRMYKFRSLQLDERIGLSMVNRRFTATGRWMRVSGLDELPQLILVLIGDMSFVGPRPMPVEYTSKYSEEHLTRFAVKPGITGWAQVNGRNGISWGKRFELDTWYVENVSFIIDLKIMTMTIVQLFKSIFNKTPVPEMQVFDGTNLN